MARIANSLATLRTQVDTAFPNRSKASDGWIGDARHQAEGSYKVSQHNPNPAGVVCALDITHDPAHGVDIARLMEELDACNDPRIYYLIANRQIDNSDDSRTPYKGVDPHINHLHISVRYDRPDLYDNGNPWALPMLGGHASAPEYYRGFLGTRILENGCRGEDVVHLQAILNDRYPLYSKLVIDGQYGAKTEAVVREFQKRSGLTADGVAGPKTYKALGI